HRLDALDETGVTELGRQMARLPVHPRLARLLMEGVRNGIADRAALAAALLSERDPFSRGGRSERGGPAAHRRPRQTSRSDLLDRVEALETFERTGRHASTLGPLNHGAARQVLKVRD